ncbi:SpoIIE family protein phosphatase [Streptomyces sp. NPDC058086]|uniref:SpoIIE family protein phosphatase n=1 Tax=Streptomyces sp. NPDC058086 TaxID=3346334 RepID=UPI0036EF256F
MASVAASSTDDRRADLRGRPARLRIATRWSEGPDGRLHCFSRATCLYATYDPASRHCVVPRAGHRPPAVICPDGRVDFPDVPAGPPLRLRSGPFATA